MSMLAVFPSHSVARWIDPEWLERELTFDKHNAAGGFADPEGARWYALPRSPLLRYRPFERLLSRLSAETRALSPASSPAG